MPATPALSRRFMLGLPLGLVAVGAGVGLVAFQGGGASAIRLSGRAMGTTYSVIASDPAGRVDAAQVQGVIDQALAGADATLSNWSPTSELSQLNALTAGEVFAPSADLRQVLQAAQGIKAASAGRFDVAIGEVIDLWGFGITGARQDAPTAYAVDALLDARQAATLDFTGDGHVVRGAANLFIPSIGKGAGVDSIAAGLKNLGLENFMVEIGGDLVTAGLNPDGTPWQIGIESPVPGARQVEQIIGISGLAMATSGDYRNYFEADGQRFSHIIDPTTAKPITHSTASVTVFADDAMHADAWSTALLVMGLDEGLALANAQGLSALFIERETGGNKLHGSAAFQALQG